MGRPKDPRIPIGNSPVTLDVARAFSGKYYSFYFNGMSKQVGVSNDRGSSMRFEGHGDGMFSLTSLDGNLILIDDESAKHVKVTRESVFDAEQRTQRLIAMRASGQSDGERDRRRRYAEIRADYNDGSRRF